MDMVLITPQRGSKSGAALARALGISKLNDKRIKTFVGSKDTLVINWGNSDPPPNVLKSPMLNKPEAIGAAVNKKIALQTLRACGANVPDFTTDEATTKLWVDLGIKAVARHTLTGSGGEGIQILESLNDFPCKAPLYTQYIPKKSEFRVHVLNGCVFDIQRKMRRKDIPDDKVNWQVRNHNNGFVFGRNGEPLEKGMYEVLVAEAVRATKGLGLDFGAVDIIWNDKRGLAYVLEVNTAPGLEGTTLENYVNAFCDFNYRKRQQVRPQARLNGRIEFEKLVGHFRNMAIAPADLYGVELDKIDHI